MTLFPLIAVLLASTLTVPEDAPGPAPPPPVQVDKTDANDVFRWDWTGLTVDGQPIAVDRTVYRFVPVTDPTRLVVAIQGAVVPGTTEHLVRDVLATVPPGRYRASVQLRSTMESGGLWGGFSSELEIEVTEGPPPAPSPRGPAAPSSFRVEARP